MKLLMSWEDIQADHLDVPACRVGYHTACDIMYPEVPRLATMLLFILPFFLTPLECVVGLVVGTCWYRDHCISSCQAKVCTSSGFSRHGARSQGHVPEPAIADE